jgi:hypothetical protein
MSSREKKSKDKSSSKAKKPKSSDAPTDEMAKLKVSKKAKSGPTDSSEKAGGVDTDTIIEANGVQYKALQVVGTGTLFCVACLLTFFCVLVFFRPFFFSRSSLCRRLCAHWHTRLVAALCAGSFGVVIQAQQLSDGELVAIKKVLQDKRFKVSATEIASSAHACRRCVAAQVARRRRCAVHVE